MMMGDKMLKALATMALLALAGCETAEDAGIRAARMEAQDDAACKGRQDYQQCRRNLMGYRHQAAAADEAKEARRDAAVANIVAITRDKPSVDVNVSCTFGCR